MLCAIAVLLGQDNFQGKVDGVGFNSEGSCGVGVVVFLVGLATTQVSFRHFSKGVVRLGC